MSRVVGCLTEQHDLWLVAAAALVCVLSWGGALLVRDHARAMAEPYRRAWLMLAGLAAGGGTWATHFISMLAFDPGLPVGFSLPMTLLSAAIGAASAWAAFELQGAQRGGYGTVAAGLILAAGIAGLHYVGMAGVQVPARQLWASDLVGASALFVAAFAVAGFAALSWRDALACKLAALAMLACGVVTLHFTAMGALTLIPDPSLVAPVHVLDREGLAATVIFGAALLVLLTAAAAFADRRVVQERLKRAEEADRAKSRFLANMSHEFRTPLNAIIGYSELIVESSADQLAVSDAERVCAAARHLLGLVNDMLDLAKIEANRLEVRKLACDLPELLEELCHSMRPAAAARRNDIVLAPDAGLPHVVGDPLRISQCLLNLLSNAVKFTEGGTIRVSARRVGDVVEVAVSDTGIGMSDEQVQGLFKPFAHGEGSIGQTHGGAGLGLSISKRLVELMRGEIGVRSAPGRGSTFTLTLPAQPAEAPVADLREAIAA